MAFDIKHTANLTVFNWMLNIKWSEDLTTNKIGWSMLNGICGKESKKASDL